MHFKGRGDTEYTDTDYRSGRKLCLVLISDSNIQSRPVARF